MRGSPPHVARRRRDRHGKGAGGADPGAREHAQRGSDRTSRGADRRGGGQGRADHLPSGNLLWSLFSGGTGRQVVRHRRAGRWPDGQADAGPGEEAQDGAGRAFLRGGPDRRLLQHRGPDRERRLGAGQVPQDPHPSRRPLFLGEVLFQAGQPRLPGVGHLGRPRRHLDLLRPALPGARPGAGAQGRRARLQPVGHGQIAVAVSLGAGAAGSRGGQRLLDRRHQPRGGGEATQRGAVLWLELLLRSARPHRRQGVGDRGRGAGRGPRPGHES